MKRNTLPISLMSGLLILAGLVASPSAQATETIFWKEVSSQKVSKGKWTNMTFKRGNQTKTTIKNSTNARALFCAKAHVKVPKGGIDYIKIRFARHLPNGKLDTTGTTTWVVGRTKLNNWQGTTCWPINTEHPVSIQIKVVGKSKSYSVYQKQFKIWNPRGGFPDTIDPIGITETPS